MATNLTASEPMVYRDKVYMCGIDVNVAVVGGKWKASILWHLPHNTMRFSDLGASSGRCSADVPETFS